MLQTLHVALDLTQTLHVARLCRLHRIRKDTLEEKLHTVWSHVVRVTHCLLYNYIKSCRLKGRQVALSNTIIMLTFGKFCFSKNSLYSLVLLNSAAIQKPFLTSIFPKNLWMREVVCLYWVSAPQGPCSLSYSTTFWPYLPFSISSEVKVSLGTCVPPLFLILDNVDDFQGGVYLTSLS